MKVTPLDLRQQNLSVGFRGYDRTEVDALLNEVADDYEGALRETEKLRQELARTESLIEEHREHERNLRNTLLTAQRLSDEIRQLAEQEARRIVEEAESRAELVVQQAQGRVDELGRDIDGLKLKRRDVETTLQATIAALRNTLDFVREQDLKDREEKVVLHRPRQTTEHPHGQQNTASPIMRALDAAAVMPKAQG